MDKLTREKLRIQAYNKKYREANPEKIRLLSAKHYAANREKRKRQANEWRLTHKEQHMATRRKYVQTPMGRISVIKASSKTRGIEYRLADEEAVKILASPCFYCGIMERVSIDRIDSKAGYFVENCVACCKMCNYMKNTFDRDEFIRQCKRIASNHP